MAAGSAAGSISNLTATVPVPVLLVPLGRGTAAPGCQYRKNGNFLTSERESRIFSQPLSAFRNIGVIGPVRLDFAERIDGPLARGVSTALARTVHSVRVAWSGKYFHTCRLLTVYFIVRKAACRRRFVTRHCRGYLPWHLKLRQIWLSARECLCWR